MRPLLFCDRCGEKKQSKLCHEMTQDKSLSCKGDIVKVEDDAEQEKDDEETVFEFFQMEEDDIDLLEPSQNEDMDAFLENDDGADDLDGDEIIAEEKLNEEYDTASNQMLCDKMK